MESIMDNLLKDKNINSEFKKSIISADEDMIMKQIELYKKLEKTAKQMADLNTKIWKNQKHEGEWRNTKFEYWRDICLKYNESDLLNCYGDIFFIDKQLNENFYLCRRVLWNLKLSKEQYYVEEINEVDSDGEYDYTDYDISVKID